MKQTLRAGALGAALVAALCAGSPAPATAVPVAIPATAVPVAIPATGAPTAIDISPGLFINNGFFWSTALTTTAGDRTVVRRTAGPNPGISVTGPTGSVFHPTFGVSKYLFFGSRNHLLLLESQADAARVTHTVTSVDFSATPPRESLIMSATASSSAVPPPRVQFSAGTGDAFLVFGSDGFQLVGIGIYRSDTGRFLCGIPPLNHLNVQLVGAATATQVRIQDGGTVLTACPKPTG